MISAKQAREIIEKAKNEKLKQEKSKIERKINSAIKSSSTFCDIYGGVSKEARIWLQDLGYTVELYSDSEGSIWAQIRW